MVALVSGVSVVILTCLSVCLGFDGVPVNATTGRLRPQSSTPWVPTLPYAEGDEYEEDIGRVSKEDLAFYLEYVRWWENEFRDPTDTNTVQGFDYQPGGYSDNRQGDRKKRDLEEAEQTGTLAAKVPGELRNLRKFYFVENNGKVRVKRFFCSRCYRPRCCRAVYRPVYYARPSCCGYCGGCYGKK